MRHDVHTISLSLSLFFVAPPSLSVSLFVFRPLSLSRALSLSLSVVYRTP